MPLTVDHMRRMVVAGACLGLATLSACATFTTDPAALEERDALLSGAVVFGGPVSTTELPTVDILETSDDMAAFLDQVVGATRIPSVKFRRVLKGLEEAGYFGANYAPDITRTAADTFSRKSGNCLSYTNMFIALARSAGLDARYQIVDVPPNWDAEAGFLIRYTHINVLLKGIGYDPALGGEFSVDFNEVLPDPDYPRHVITDREAAALYYANRSISLLRSGASLESFLYLKKSLELDPDNADLWINLGAFYAKHESHSQALSAYQVALHFDPHSRGAMSGMARAHLLLGNQAEAERYELLVRRYRDRNPYYHYAIAQTEYDQANYDKALKAINAAINLKYRSGRFHFLKGLAEYQLGDSQAAQESFRRATRFGNIRDLKQRYVSDLATLQPLS